MKNKGEKKMFRQNRRIGGGTPACIVPFNSCKSKSNLRNILVSAVILSGFGVSNIVKAESKFYDANDTYYASEYVAERTLKDFPKDDYLDYHDGEYAFTKNGKMTAKEKDVYSSKLKRIDGMYAYFNSCCGMNVNNWKKLSPTEKLNNLYDFLVNITEENKAKLNKMVFSDANQTNIQKYTSKVLDDFDEKVEGLSGETKEEEFLDKNLGKVKVVTTSYVDKDGKKFEKRELTYPNGSKSTELLESNQPLFDYYDVEKRTGNNGDYWVAYSHNYSVDGTDEGNSGIGSVVPDGYVVAVDRSKHLSNDEKGKFVIIPKDKSLLPDGVEVKDDGRGGYIVNAPETAYKKNGNLNLKPDSSLSTLISIDRSRGYDSTEANEFVRIDEMQVQNKKLDSYGRHRPLTGSNGIYYSYSTQKISDGAENESTNYEAVFGKTTEIRKNGQLDVKTMNCLGHLCDENQNVLDGEK